MGDSASQELKALRARLQRALPEHAASMLRNSLKLMSSETCFLGEKDGSW